MFSIIFSLIIPLVPVGSAGPFPTLDRLAPPASKDHTELVNKPVYYDAAAGMEIELIAPAAKTRFGSIIPFIPLLTGLYIAIVLILFVRLLRIIHMIQMKSDRNPRTLFNGYEVVLLSENVVPHTFLSTIYVNKKLFEQGLIKREVLLHELTHARQKHSIDILFVEVLKILTMRAPPALKQMI
jgi:hypothetical protein